MRRALFALVATVAGLVALLSYRSTAHQVSRDAALGYGTSDREHTTRVYVPHATGPRSTATGPDIITPYGDVRVAVTLTGRTLTAVTPVTLPFDNPTSQQVTSYAAPILGDEALRAQSARIDTVSGATQTSDGYRQSLAAALSSAQRLATARLAQPTAAPSPAGGAAPATTRSRP